MTRAGVAGTWIAIVVIPAEAGIQREVGECSGLLGGCTGFPLSRE